MSLLTLRERLRVAREDDLITRAEVDALIRSALTDGNVNFQEALLLQAELDAHPQYFEPEAYQLLRDFLERNRPKRG
jgi:hypothetical protein